MEMETTDILSGIETFKSQGELLKSQVVELKKRIPKMGAVQLMQVLSRVTHTCYNGGPNADTIFGKVWHEQVKLLHLFVVHEVRARLIEHENPNVRLFPQM